MDETTHTPRNITGTDHKVLRMNARAIRQDFEDLVPKALNERQETAKVIALFADRSPRTVENYRAGLTYPGVPEFFALAQHIPALRSKALEWLGASNASNDQNPVEVAAYLMQAIGSLPQETINAALRKIDAEKRK